MCDVCDVEVFVDGLPYVGVVDFGDLDFVVLLLDVWLTFWLLSIC